jgi:hypothetical protein
VTVSRVPRRPKTPPGQRIFEAVRAMPYQKGVDGAAIYDVGADGEAVTREMD